jgi:DNA-binding NtrC family response regulator
VHARILVVDDEPDILGSMAETLRAAFPSVVVDMAAHGAEAQARMRSSRYDLLLTDERMPGLRGRDLVAWAAERQPGLVSVIATAFAELFRDRAPGDLPRVRGILAKPFDRQQLVDTVRAALAGARGPAAATCAR